MQRFHGVYPADIVPPSSRYFDTGRFGRMFGKLLPFARNTDAIRSALLDIGRPGGIMDAGDDLSAGPAALITDPSKSVENSDNPRLRAGMTFLGQFLDHDMSFDPTSSLERQVDPEHIANFRTPTLALDSVYGAGPKVNPHLYDQTKDGIEFLVETLPGPSGKMDLPRNSQMTALIGDPRNDENLIVSQLHLAFLLFHNRVVQYVRTELGLTDSAEIFLEAQRLVRWHYQWMVLHEFLPLTCGETVVDTILDEGRRFYKWRNEPFIPVEFSVAAYRFGHSQVRPSYRAHFSGAGGLDPFFAFIFGASAAGDPDPDDLRGSTRAPRRFVEWPTFFDFNDGQSRPGKKIDTTLSTPLFELPPTIGAVPNPHPIANPNSLAARNLLRHLTFSLPSGQRVAKMMKEEPVSVSSLEPWGLEETTPLWFYVLHEADAKASGRHLGPVGGRIVAEVMIGLIDGDPTSYLSQDPVWKPQLPTLDPSDEGKDFRMVDLLRCAGVA